MKLTKEQRFEMIQLIIENDSDQLYKPRDIFHAYFYGITPYKDMHDSELKEYYENAEIDIPKQENLALLCTDKDCYAPQNEDGEFCETHSPLKDNLK